MIISEFIPNPSMEPYYLIVKENEKGNYHYSPKITANNSEISF